MFSSVALRILSVLEGFAARARDEDGQTVAEYGMIITVVAVATIVLAITLFRDSITSAFNAAINCLDGTC
jgi:Flp pilus assembly pilin Flp